MIYYKLSLESIRTTRRCSLSAIIYELLHGAFSKSSPLTEYSSDQSLYHLLHPSFEEHYDVLSFKGMMRSGRLDEYVVEGNGLIKTS
jgi:hypothetical protein